MPKAASSDSISDALQPTLPALAPATSAAAAATPPHQQQDLDGPASDADISEAAPLVLPLSPPPLSDSGNASVLSPTAAGAVVGDEDGSVFTFEDAAEAQAAGSSTASFATVGSQAAAYAAADAAAEAAAAQEAAEEAPADQDAATRGEKQEQPATGDGEGSAAGGADSAISI